MGYIVKLPPKKLPNISSIWTFMTFSVDKSKSIIKPCTKVRGVLNVVKLVKEDRKSARIAINLVEELENVIIRELQET